MDAETYASLPAELTLREVRVALTTPGVRTRVVTIATTLVDSTVYAKDAIADLYHRRWHIEMFHPHYPSSDNLYHHRRAA